MKTKRYQAVFAAFCLAATAIALPAFAEEAAAVPEAVESVEQESQNADISVAELFTEQDLSGDYASDSAVSISLADGASTADAEGVSIDGDTILISAAGTYVFSGSLSNGQIQVDVEDGSVQLVLDGVSISNESSAAIYIKKADQAYITLTEGAENSLTVSGEFVAIDDNDIDAAIFSKAKLSLNGSGSLTIDCAQGHAISSKKDLKVAGGTYEITCSGKALAAKNSIAIADGIFTITAEGKGINSKKSDDETEGLVYIAGGIINILQSDEGIEGTRIIIDGGEVYVNSSDDGINAANGASTVNEMEADPECSLTINGGKITVVAGGDGIDSNGSVTVTGGELIVVGPETGADSALDYDGTAIITGGTVLAIGYSQMAQNFGSSSTQASMLVSFSQITTGEVKITDANGTVIASYTPDRNYNSVVISSPELVVGETYTVSGGEESQEITLDSLIYGSGFGFGPGGSQGGPGASPEGQAPGESPEGQAPGEMPEGQAPGEMPEGESPAGPGQGEVPAAPEAGN